MTGEQETLREFGRPAGLDELQIAALIRTIDFVTHDGMPRVREVDADLVHAAGLGECADDAEFAAVAGGEFHAFLDFEARDRSDAIRVHGLFEIDFRVPDIALPEDRSIDRPFVLRRPAPDDRQVFLSDTPAFHLHAEESCRLIGLGDESEPAGFAIEPVDEGDLAAVDDLIGEQIPKSVPQRVCLPRFAWVGLEEWRLIDDEKLRGLVDDLETGYNLLLFRRRIVRGSSLP